ncbi:MAG: hypothetical protein ACI8PP_000801 [Candidatus Pseudothioglobus sp.]|jgi:hypothetical protein
MNVVELAETAVTIGNHVDLAAIVKQIDPALHFVKDLHVDAAAGLTLLVRMGKVQCVLRVRANTDILWDEKYFQLELLALHRVAERDLNNVAHLVNYYRCDTYEAILKTFIKGSPCNRLDIKTLFKDRHFIHELDCLYLQLHLAGIAKINFGPRKIVLCDNNTLALVDLRSCVVDAHVGINQFSWEQRQDSYFITRLERQARF